MWTIGNCYVGTMLITLRNIADYMLYSIFHVSHHIFPDEEFEVFLQIVVFRTGKNEILPVFIIWHLINSPHLLHTVRKLNPC